MAGCGSAILSISSFSDTTVHEAMYEGVMIPRKKGGKGTAYLAGARGVVDERLLLCIISSLQAAHSG